MINRRDRLPPIPTDPNQHLSINQRNTLSEIEGFGYRLKFIRRPLFQTPTVVVENIEQTKCGVLEQDGTINMAHNMSFRD
ncbi:hypothetical protein IMCC21906_00731 [Spongiibacter sp. IMCC21906]|uniref:hypothetical protein n=1 Tax=Spongiibacter sp. IMCC21906 TaxID=1620392 RepID=UPI00062DFB89|nr:hypothetical protein [Spongiibacter sp. IMCC21906]AKH68423.1 hypothetical protein IMCC21906_00731 [Spongiibacter sp. IMCC21906]